MNDARTALTTLIREYRSENPTDRSEEFINWANQQIRNNKLYDKVVAEDLAMSELRTHGDRTGIPSEQTEKSTEWQPGITLPPAGTKCEYDDALEGRQPCIIIGYTTAGLPVVEFASGAIKAGASDATRYNHAAKDKRRTQLVTEINEYTKHGSFLSMQLAEHLVDNNWVQDTSVTKDKFIDQVSSIAAHPSQVTALWKLGCRVIKE